MGCEACDASGIEVIKCKECKEIIVIEKEEVKCPVCKKKLIKPHVTS